MGRLETFRPNPINSRFETLSSVFELANGTKNVYTPPTRSNGHYLYMKTERRNGAIYPDELRLKEILSQGVKMLVPRNFLYGRQVDSSYGKRKRHIVEHNLRERGLEFLLSEPIITCALPARDKLQIVIVDGHHRARYSSEFGINDIPSVIYSPQQIVDAFNLRNSTRLDAEALTKQLETEVAETYSSFRSLPDRKLPKLAVGYNNIQDLPFKRF